MHESSTTLMGNVVTEPRHVVLQDELHITNFRLASTPRHWDKGTKTWVDGETSYYTVNCFRHLAQNAAASIRRGDPVVVTGSLRVREWVDGDRRGVVTEVQALTVGHDLTRGTSRFERVSRARTVSPEEDAARQLAADPEGPVVDPATGEVMEDSLGERDADAA